VAQKNMGCDKIEVDQFENLMSFAGKLAKYNPSGNLIWLKQMGGRPSGYLGSSTVRLDKAGNIYTTGEFNYTQDFDPGPGVFNLTAFGNGYPYDAFICRVDPNGNFVYAKG